MFSLFLVALPLTTTQVLNEKSKCLSLCLTQQEVPVDGLGLLEDLWLFLARVNRWPASDSAHRRGFQQLPTRSSFSILLQPGLPRMTPPVSWLPQDGQHT